MEICVGSVAVSIAVKRVVRSHTKLDGAIAPQSRHAQSPHQATFILRFARIPLYGFRSPSMSPVCLVPKTLSETRSNPCLAIQRHIPKSQSTRLDQNS
jgi:hypothetical protein